MPFRRVWIHCAVGLVVFIIGFLTMAPSRGFGFVWDDFTLLLGWHEVHSLEYVPELLGGSLPFHHQGLYRPVRSLFYALSYHFFQTNASLYHLQASVIHGLGTLAVFLVVTQLNRFIGSTWPLKTSPTLPLVSALLFAVHPIHVESIAWISASFDAAGMVLALIGLYWYLKSRLDSRLWIIPALGFFVVAALTNEITYVTPMVVLLFEWFHSQTRLKRALQTPSVWLVWAAVSLVAGMRFVVLEIGARFGLVLDSAVTTAMVVISGLARGFVLHLVPFKLTPNPRLLGEIWAFHHQELWPPGTISKPSLFEPVWLVSLLLIVTLTGIAWHWRRKHPLISLAIGWYFVWMIPLMQFIPQSSLFGERYFYAASLGPLLLVAMLWQLAISRFGMRIPSMVLAVVAIVWLTTTTSYMRVFESNVSFWTHAYNSNPDSVYSRNDLAKHLFESGQVEKAESMLKAAVKANPRHVPATTNLASIYISQQRYNEAIGLLTFVAKIAPDYYQAYEKLGAAYMNQGKFMEAVPWFEKILKYEPHNDQIYRHIGRAYQGAWVLSEAIRYYKASLELEFSLEVLGYLADCYFDSALNSQAIEAYETILTHDPANQHALSQLALLKNE